VVGVVLGQIIGALPGIGPSAGMALLLPLTFGLPPVTAIVMLAGIMYGGMYGGTLTSVLLNVPGEAASVMTAVDGYQIARRGRAGAALSVAAIGSFSAGMAAVAALALLTPLLSEFALRFNAPEYFLLASLGITASASLGGASAVKALMAALLGLMIAMVGVDPITGIPRLTSVTFSWSRASISSRWRSASSASPRCSPHLSGRQSCSRSARPSVPCG
jgi:putative tricarboxylic transport membrane protein